MSGRPGNRQRSLERPRYAGGSDIGYTRASCFSELFGLPGPSPHQSLAVRVHIPVESSSSTTFDIGTPTVERCLVIQRPSGVGAFQFVVLASLRAAQLVRGCRPKVDGLHKATVIAQLEVSAGIVMQVLTLPDTTSGPATVGGAPIKDAPAMVHTP